MKEIRIALVGGFASTNIGNDFFTQSIRHVLSEILPGQHIIVTQNLPGYYWKEGGTNPANSFNYIKCLELDFLVLTGPLFDASFPLLWEDTISALKKKGTEIILFSAGSQRYDEAERRVVGEFLKKIKPYALVTRDTPTYEAFREYAQMSYDGIDFAFFLNDLFTPYPLDVEKFVVLNFDTGPEPRFGRESQYENGFTFLGNRMSYRLQHPGKMRKRVYKHLPGLSGYHNSSFGNYTIIRPVNYINPGNRKGFFRVPNTYVSELAFDYLNLFAHAQGVLTSRVHTCIASLVFGKEVMLFSPTLRRQLFGRVGLEDITLRPVTLDPDYLRDEKEKMLVFIKGIFT
ncbi:MAG: polysaccharide pyruvyl transferase family protein [Bacteroidota bacterium]